MKEARPDFRSVFDGQLGYIWNTLRRLGVRDSDLMDQAQEVFLNVHALLGDYDPARPIRPWLFAITWRCAARYRSLAHLRREVVTDELDVVDPAQGALEHVAVREAEGLFARALESVASSRRNVFLMADVDGASAPDIAEALGIPVNTVYSRLRLAREEFTAAVRRLRGVP